MKKEAEDSSATLAFKEMQDKTIVSYVSCRLVRMWKNMNAYTFL